MWEASSIIMGFAVCFVVWFSGQITKAQDKPPSIEDLERLQRLLDEVERRKKK